MHLSPAFFIKKYSVKLEPIPVYNSEKFPAPAAITGKKTIKAVFFDLYGTLFISEAGDIALSIKKKESNFFYKTFEICEIKNLTNHSDANRFGNLFYKKIIEKHKKEKVTGNETPEIDIRNIWKETLTDFGILKNSNEIEKIAVIYESLINKTWPMTGIKNILNFISNKGIPMGIISNAQFYSKYLFEAYLKKSAFKLGFIKSLCYYSYKSGIAKPGKAMFEQALDEIKKERGITAEETLFVGNDMLNDIKPAAITGMQTCLFAGDKRSLRLRTGSEETKGIAPDYVITELYMLKNILDKY